jgi:hypothetical protein
VAADVEDEGEHVEAGLPAHPDCKRWGFRFDVIASGFHSALPEIRVHSPFEVVVDKVVAVVVGRVVSRVLCGLNLGLMEWATGWAVAAAVGHDAALSRFWRRE